MLTYLNESDLEDRFGQFIIDSRSARFYTNQDIEFDVYISPSSQINNWSTITIILSNFYRDQIVKHLKIKNAVVNTTFDFIVMWLHKRCG